MQNMMHVIAVADVLFIMMIKYATVVISHVASVFYNFFTIFTKTTATTTPVCDCGGIIIIHGCGRGWRS